MDAEGTVSKAVQDLLAEPGQDNYDSLASNAELRTRGYNLNGAFRFTVDRTNGQASLQPTAGLLALCPFNPPRPRQQDNFPTTCVTRRGSLRSRVCVLACGFVRVEAVRGKKGNGGRVGGCPR